jgi:competence protein ComEC
MRKKSAILISVTTMLLVGCLAIVFANDLHLKPRACRFIALDVSQGDATLIRTPDGQDMLVDGGLTDAVIPALERNLPLGDNDLELVVATHPDGDHVGGLSSVLAKYEVKSILTNGDQATTKIDERWRQAAATESAKNITARAGVSLTLGEDLRIDVLWPSPEWLASPASKEDGTNGNSVVLRLTCAGSTAVLSGDAPTDVESRLIDSQVEVRAALLKLGHHGSKFSSSDDWLQAVQPVWGIISVGKNNRYGHPHPAVLERLRLNNITPRRTDLEGDIKLVSDGRGGWK